MVKLTKRKGFNFFRSYFDVYNELNDADKLQFIDALLNRQFMGVKPEGLTGMAKFAYISQTNSIDSQVKGWEDKTKTKLNTLQTPPTDGGKNTPTLQVEGKGEGKGEGEGKEKLNTITIRVVRFKKSLLPFLDKYGTDVLKDFSMYWTEHNPRGKKMRFELAKNQPFNPETRLTRWLINKKQFEKEKSSGKKEKTLITNR